MSQDKPMRDRYIELLGCDIEFYGMAKKAQAEFLGVNPSTLWRWENDLTAEEWENIRAERRRKANPIIAMIDVSMIRKAIKGDVRAAELALARIENWTMPQRHEVTATRDSSLDDKTNFELLQGALAGLTPGEREQLLSVNPMLIESKNDLPS